MEQATIIVIDQEHSDIKERLEKKWKFKVVANTNNLDIGFIQAEKHQPTLIMLNMDLPGVTDIEGSDVAEVFAQEFPFSSLVLMTTSTSKQILHHAIQVGAKDIISLPAEDDHLYRVVNKVVKQEFRRRELFTVKKRVKPQFKTITVFSTKGGVGKTTVALNLAIAIRQISKKRVALVDLDLMSGNVALMAGLKWKRSIKDLVDEINNLDDEETLDSYLGEHSSGIKILPAPIHPEYASFVQTEHVEIILKQLSKAFNYVIVDGPAYFHDTVIPALEQAQDIAVVTTLDLASIQNLKQCKELLAGLSLQSKAKIVINKLGFTGGLKAEDLGKELEMDIKGIIPSCEKIALNAVNLGDPIILSAKNSDAARQFENLAHKFIFEDDYSSEKISWSNRIFRKWG